MKPAIRSDRSLRTAAILATLLGVGAAFAEPQMSAVSGQLEERRAGLVSEGTAKRLNQLLELSAKEQYDEVIVGLNAMLGKVRGEDYETALVEMNLGYAYLGKGGADNYRIAISHLEKALALKALPVSQENSIVYTVAQLYAQAENYPKTIQMLEMWFRATTNPPAQAFILMASAYAAQDKYRDALPWVNKAIASSDKPQESWYKLLLGIQYELKDYKACAEVLETLTSLYPDNKKYWEQLTGMYMELNQDSKALAIMALANRRGFIADDKQMLNLVRLYILNDAPFEAGTLLEAALASKQVAGTDKTYALLGEAWMQAREWKRAAEAFGKGGELAADGDMLVRKAQIHVDQLDYNAAMKAIDRAFLKGNLKRPGYAHMIAGRAAAETKNYKAAEDAFRRARAYDDTKGAAASWLDYLAELQLRR